MRKKINVYDAFIEGAKEGFQTAITIIPYLVAILVGIGVFRASGAMDFIIQGVRFGIASIGLNTDFVEALPTMLMKPLSGSGARGMMLEHVWSGLFRRSPVIHRSGLLRYDILCSCSLLR